MKLNDNEKRGFIFSVIFHIFCCGLVGILALSAYRAVSPEPVYDVALVGGGGDAAPEMAEPEPEEPQEEEEEEIQPQKEDITEQRVVPVKKKATEKKTSNKPKYTAPGGKGQGTSPGVTSGKGPGEGPAGDAIQAPAVPPRVTRSRVPSYPESARAQKVTGTAIVRFLVGKNGGVESVSLARSSGNGALDQAALNAAGGFRFRAGLDGYGRPIRCYAYQPFAFRL